MPQHKSILIMAGGTGGHVYPALAVADYLRDQGVAVFWLGTKSGLESRIVPDNDYSLLTITVTGLRGKGIIRWLLAPFMLAIAVIQALFIIIRIKPGAVLGMGGFASGPGGIAAWILRVPLFIHEQNSIAGLTNRLLAPLAKAVMQGFPGTFKQTDRLHTTGNPVRAELIELPGPEQRWAERGQDDAMHLLILGGSLGARALNLTFPAVFQHLKKDIDIEVWHQTGQRNLDETKQRYADVKVTGQVRIAAFIDDMAEAYQWADLVLCRAGALTIAELCVVGVASILVPFPYAVDDHQMTNARHLSDNGCAVLIPESALQEKWLATLLSEFHKARRRLLDMADKARQLARPDATREVGDICLEALHA